MCGSGYNLIHNLCKDIPQGDPALDAATANMGSPWKMPTSDQCQELINEAVSGWTTVNGVNGRKFFNNTDSANYIFIPASGIWSNTQHSNLDIYEFWCTKWYNMNEAYAMGSSSPNIGGTSSQFGYRGLSVRAIQVSKSNFSKSEKSNE